jgi:hypothetical protein
MTTMTTRTHSATEQRIRRTAAGVLLALGVTAATGATTGTAAAPTPLDDLAVRISEPPLVGPFLDEVDADVEKVLPDELDGPQPASSQQEAFSLHSRPSATRKIFLDFDGHVTTNTPWNSSAYPTIVSGVYSRESAGSRDSTLSTSELDGIVDVWQRVREDFAAWDVDVTTQDPGTAGLTKSSPSDSTYGIRVVISQDHEWYGPYGGGAYLYSFGWQTERPAFVFSSNLANGNPKSIGEAVSHEVGHSLGLSHDGLNQSDGTVLGYYSGHGSWAPIMGVGYSRPVTQWSRGEYAGASNTEDDLQIIDASLARLPDVSGSTTLGGSDSSITLSMVAGNATARHPLIVPEGPTTVTVRKASTNGNLLAEVTIRNSANAVVASSTPADSTGWTLTTQLGTGSYTVEVRSIGWQSPSTGFSAYASLGDYVIDVDVPGTTPTTSTTTTTTPAIPATTPATTTPPVEKSGAGDRLTSISPQRLVDTRVPGAPFGRLAAGQEVRLAVTGLPDDASAAVVNITAIRPSSTGWMSITPCQPVEPEARTSSVNFLAGQNVANSIIAPVSADGALCVYASAATDVAIDITGWTEPDGVSALVELGSSRLVDTRSGLGISRPLTPGARTVVSLASITGATVPDAVAVNVTAVNPSQAGFITVGDCSLGSSTTSSLNFSAGETRGNNGIFSLSASRALCVTSSVETHLTVDVTGQFVPGDGLTFVAAEPTRVLDTRSIGRIDAGSSTGFAVPAFTSENGLSVAPVAASVNIVAALHTDRGHVTAWDCGARPETSALNPVAGAPTANSALVPVTATGRSCLYHSIGGHLIVDLNGWWV